MGKEHHFTKGMAMKKILLGITMLIIYAIALAQVPTKLKIEDVEKNGGKIYVSIFNRESSYKARVPYMSFSINADNGIVICDLTLPAGHYVFSIYQDTNGNQKLDTNLIGIPKEKFGFTNYDGKSAPGSFNRHKIEINAGKTELNIRLYKI